MHNNTQPYEAAEPCFTAAELMKQELGPPRWAVTGLIGEGVTLLAGKPKKRKSWLALDLAIAVASGATFLGKWPTKQGEVLYLALEDGKRRLQTRVQKLTAATDPALNHIHIQTQWPQLDRGGVEAIREWLDAHANARLVIIDTLAKVRAVKGNGKPGYEEDYQCLKEIKKLADERGIAVLFLTHTRKIKADDVYDTINATLGLTGAADTTLVLVVFEDDQGEGVLHANGRDVESQEERIVWDNDKTRWALSNKPVPTKAGSKEKQVLAALKVKPMTYVECATKLGRSESAMKTMFSRLNKKNLILKKEGKYITNPTVVLD